MRTNTTLDSLLWVKTFFLKLSRYQFLLLSSTELSPNQSTVQNSFAIKKSKALNVEAFTEALISTHLDSPYVMRAEGISLTSTEVKISMELMDMDLSRYLDSKQSDRSSGWRESVSYQCSKSLSYLHSKNIIHRDIKPANYLVKVNPSGSVTVRLTDFGFCHIGLKARGWMGTPGYIAPEMFDDEKSYDEKVDCWSLGAVLYEVLTNTTLVEKVEEQLNPTPKWEKVKAYMPTHVSAVKRLLVVDPMGRMSSRSVVAILKL